MKVKELIERLKKVNENLPVYCSSVYLDFEYAEVNTAKVKQIEIDGKEGEDDYYQETFIISEEI